MLSIKDFNDADIVAIRTIPKSFRVTAFIYALFFIPISFVIGLLGLTKNGPGYFTSTMIVLLLFALALSWNLLNQYIYYKKDLTEKSKLCGTIRVTKKEIKKGDTIIFTDSTELKQLNLHNKEIFDKIDIGDNLQIEISKFSKHLLRLEKIT